MEPKSKFEVGDLVEHTNSHRRGHITTVRECRDGTFELQVCISIDFDGAGVDGGSKRGHFDIWWNSRRVVKLDLATETSCVCK